MTLFTFNVIKILIFFALSSVVAFLLTPSLIKILNKLKFWKKKAREKTIMGEQADVFNSLHKEREVLVPRGGGLLIWISVVVVTFFIFLISQIQDPWWLKNLNFFTRERLGFHFLH